MMYEDGDKRAPDDDGDGRRGRRTDDAEAGGKHIHQDEIERRGRDHDQRGRPVQSSHCQEIAPQASPQAAEYA